MRIVRNGTPGLPSRKAQPPAGPGEDGLLIRHRKALEAASTAGHLEDLFRIGPGFFIASGVKRGRIARKLPSPSLVSLLIAPVRKPLPSGLRHEPDAQLLAGFENSVGLNAARPERIFIPQRRDRLHGMGAADGMGTAWNNGKRPFEGLYSTIMLEPLGSNLWFADGGVVSFKGFDYPTRMVVVRLADGGLWLWSPVERTAAIEDAIRALGPVRHIVSPNKLHYLFLGEWQAAFPDANLWATAATIAKCKELRFSGTLADEPPAEWQGQIDQFYFTNSPFMDELIFFHRASRTAIIADLSQTFSERFLKSHWPWWMRPMARFSKMVEGWGYPPIDYRLSFRHRASARPKIRELIGKHPEHVVVAHGEVVRTDGESFLRRAFSWLLPTH